MSQGGANDRECANDCGSLIIGGFEGHTLPSSFAKALGDGELGGAILFRRNLGDIQATLALSKEIAEASGGTPFLAIDQEGGRVARLGPPFLSIPPALWLGQLCEGRDGDLLERIAKQQARELRALGVTVNFAPVFDVHSEEANPIIGNRAFGTTPLGATRGALAYASGLLQGGVLPCAKHFPGHGRTLQDSHEALPRVDASLDSLHSVEIPPFVAAAQADLPLMMTAHVVYSAIDSVPATLSFTIATTLLRDELSFKGALLSDDLEMRAITDRYSIEESAVLAVQAGCDGVLICRSEELQARAFTALRKEAERSEAFRLRVKEANVRMDAARRRIPELEASTVELLSSILESKERRNIEVALEVRGAFS